MRENEFEDDPLDLLLDSESEEAFGVPEIRDRFDPRADESVSGDLATWTAQDFASIYVRFRPHLERHASRYLSNKHQAEEVVQDAFLYLMTSLPELDSELGVLKFLKWKTKLLALDVLSSSSMKKEVAVSEHDEHAANSEEIYADLERAEDIAIIQMALSKLSPRQREALIANVYEEKSSDEIASQLNLSPNATRQLVFRARNAFRKALVGEAEIKGKSVSQILTLAAKKAAVDARKNSAKIGAFILVVAGAVGVWPTLTSLDDQNTTLAGPEDAAQAADPIEIAGGSSSTDSNQSEEIAPGGSPTEDAPREDSNQPAETIETAEPVVNAPIQEELVIETAASAAVEQENALLLPQSFSSVLATNATSAFFYSNSKPDIFQAFDGESIQIFAGTGVSAFLDFRPDELTIYNAILQVRVQDELLFAVPTEFKKSTLYDGSSFDLVFEGSNFYLVRSDGSVVSDSVIWDAKSRAVVKLDTDGEVIETSLNVSR